VREGFPSSLLLGGCRLWFGCDGHLNLGTWFEAHLITIFIEQSVPFLVELDGETR
jgi:hypothetical protein